MAALHSDLQAPDPSKYRPLPPDLAAPDPASVLPANLAAPYAPGVLPPHLAAPDPAGVLPPDLAAPEPPKAPPAGPQHDHYLGRITDIPSDIAGVFRQGVGEVRDWAHRRDEEVRAPGFHLPQPWDLRGQLHGAGEFLSLVGGAADVAFSPIKGVVRSMVARPLGEHYPLNQRVAEFNARTPSERGLASARTSVGEEHTAPPDPNAPPLSSDQRTQLMERFTDLVTPGLGVVPYSKVARALFTRPPTTPLAGFTGAVADDLFRIRQQGTADRAELTSQIRAMPPEQRTADVQRMVYDLIENGGNSPRLSLADQALWNTHSADVMAAMQNILPMRTELSDIYNRLRNLGFPEGQLVNPNYMHRRAVGHTPAIDPPLGSGGSDNPIFGATRSLPQTTSALQARQFIGGMDASGHHVVVSQDPYGEMFVHEPGGTAGIQVHLHPTNPDQFLYNGRTWSLGDTTSMAVERATAGEPHPTTYYHNALANTADALLRMRAVERHVNYLDHITRTPEWNVWATRNPKLARRLGRPGTHDEWKQPMVPQLRDSRTNEGWYLHPKLRAAFDDFYRPGMGESEALDAMRKVNQFATHTMFWNPTPHVENVLGHWIVGRGWDWLKPSGLQSLFQDGARAIREVTTQGPEYRRLLRQGSGMAFGGVMNADFYKQVARLAGMDIMRNAPRWDPIARMVGVGPSDLVRALYTGASRALWAANDVMMMQRVLELERRMPIHAAISEAEKHIPNYRIPTEVMGSRAFSQILQEPAFTVFSRYHYGMFRSYVNMLNDLFRGSPHEKLDAVGNMVFLGLLTWVVYPQLDRAIRAATGNENDRKLRRGPSTIPDLVGRVWEGDESLARIMGDAMTLALPIRVAPALADGGRDPFTGQPIMNPKSDAVEQAGQFANWGLGQVVQPWQLVNGPRPDEGGRTPLRAMTDQILGLKNTSDRSEIGRRRAERALQRQANKRRNHPRGPIEEFVHQVYGGGD